MVIEMQFFGMRIEKSETISDAMNFYEVFWIDLVINQGKAFLSTSKSLKVVLQYILVFQNFDFFSTLL